MLIARMRMHQLEQLQQAAGGWRFVLDTMARTQFSTAVSAEAWVSESVKDEARSWPTLAKPTLASVGVF